MDKIWHKFWVIAQISNQRLKDEVKHVESKGIKV